MLIQDIKTDKNKTLAELLDNDSDFIIYGNTKQNKIILFKGKDAIVEDISIRVNNLLNEVIRL